MSKRFEGMFPDHSVLPVASITGSAARDARTGEVRPGTLLDRAGRVFRSDADDMLDADDLPWLRLGDVARVFEQQSKYAHLMLVGGHKEPHLGKGLIYWPDDEEAQFYNTSIRADHAQEFMTRLGLWQMYCEGGYYVDPNSAAQNERVDDGFVWLEEDEMKAIESYFAELEIDI